MESLIPIDEPQSPSQEMVNDSNCTTFMQPVRLPQLDLKTFSGNSAEWINFINLFDSAVHLNTSLSPSVQPPPIAKPSKPSTATPSVVASAQPEMSLSISQPATTVLLGTALIKITATNGISHVFRCLLDSGSQLNFMTERAAQLLNVSRHRSTHTIVGISASQSSTKGHALLELSTLGSEVIASNQPFHILDRISAPLPRTQLSFEVYELVKPFVLADPTFHIPQNIDILIGGALFPELLTHQSYPLGSNLPFVIGTRLGFVLMGNAPTLSNSSPTSCHSSLLSTTDELHNTLLRFWQQEEVPQCNLISEDDRIAEDHFKSTHSRSPDGTYVVRLPFKDQHQPLGTSKSAAEHRLHSIERKFESNSNFKELYTQFMTEYEHLGHMVKASPSDLSQPHYYLPHHGVLKETSSTTKLRTVFDGSCKTSTGVSLNDILLTGRKLQIDICDILLNFRSHNYVFSCDIRKMYRWIQVHPDDQKYQLILWRDPKTQEISTYKLTTVTYGLSSSPFHAIRTLHQLADDEGGSFPAAAKVLRDNTYVDDIICGAHTLNEAKQLRDQLIELLARGGFELRKWTSNCPEILQDLPQDHLETPVFLEATNHPHFAILGLHWSPISDCFTYNLSLPDGPPTKRSVLSIIARIFDPTEFLSPVTMWAKTLMQILWSQELLKSKN
ncbi:uncharacterized protein LOC128995504 [Macrosteles quadrilineatus]|uniref:uncharacterized protein LOC128995504 n=1 Tax=Macrosteles quadrilineatus TaxID=74068 RepID=UPI0023E189B0|nr:uncharacterized protein LOC128995504 [Macrosteles quadrilineatus]